MINILKTFGAVGTLVASQYALSQDIQTSVNHYELICKNISETTYCQQGESMYVGNSNPMFKVDITSFQEAKTLENCKAFAETVSTIVGNVNPQSDNIISARGDGEAPFIYVEQYRKNLKICVNDMLGRSVAVR